MNISITLVELNCWKANGRWHFDHLPRKAGSFLSALQFKLQLDKSKVEGWLPLKLNMSGQLHQKTSEAIIDWADGECTLVRFKNIKDAYWNHLSGDGHTDKQMSDIRKSLEAS